MFGKLHESLWTGSMVGAGSHVFAVWCYAISNGWPDGHVELNPRLLSAIIGEPVERIEAAIAYLESPDPMSRRADHDGSRLIREGAFAYFLPTYKHYKELCTEEQRREVDRERKREWRGQTRDISKILVRDMSGTSPETSASCPNSKSKSKSKSTTTTTARAKENEAPALPFHSPAFETAWTAWTSHRREIRHALTPRSERMQLAQCLGWGEARAIAAIKHSIAQGYRGLYDPHGNEPRKPAGPSQSTQAELEGGF